MIGGEGKEVIQGRVGIKKKEIKILPILQKKSAKTRLKPPPKVYQLMAKKMGNLDAYHTLHKMYWWHFI